MSDQTHVLDFRGVYRVRNGETAMVVEWKDGCWQGYLTSGLPETWNEVGNVTLVGTDRTPRFDGASDEQSRMTSAADTILEYRDELERVCKCRLRLFQQANLTIALATDESDRHQCNSVTNTAQQIATAVCQQFGLNPARLMMIEHYDDRAALARAKDQRSRETLSLGRENGESFDLVQLRWNGQRFGQPDWQRLTKARVEELIGFPLP